MLLESPASGLPQALSARRRKWLCGELVEYFAHDYGAIPSAHHRFVNMALSGVGGAGSDPDLELRRMHRIHLAVGRQAEVRRAFYALESYHRDTLWAAFGAHRWPRELALRLGPTAGAALRVPLEPFGGPKAGDATKAAKWLLALAVKGDARIAEIGRARDTLVDGALRAYSERRKKERAAC